MHGIGCFEAKSPEGGMILTSERGAAARGAMFLCSARGGSDKGGGG